HGLSGRATHGGSGPIAPRWLQSAAALALRAWPWTKCRAPYPGPTESGAARYGPEGPKPSRARATGRGGPGLGKVDRNGVYRSQTPDASENTDSSPGPAPC